MSVFEVLKTAGCSVNKGCAANLPDTAETGRIGLGIKGGNVRRHRIIDAACARIKGETFAVIFRQKDFYRRRNLFHAHAAGRNARRKQRKNNERTAKEQRNIQQIQHSKKTKVT